MRQLLRPFWWLYCTYALVLFLIGMVCALPFVAVFALLDESAGGDRIYRVCRYWDQAKRYVFVSNHISYIDIPLILQAVGRNALRILGKAEMTRYPLFGFIYSRAVILVDRSTAAARSRSVRELKSVLAIDRSVFIFPEGTFNETGRPLKSFYDGAFRIAIETQTPIQPILFLDSFDRMHYSSLFSLRPGATRAVFLREIDVQGLTLADLPGLKQQVFDRMAEGLVRYRVSWIQTAGRLNFFPVICRSMFAEVIIPLALPTNYTWSVPEEWQTRIREGCRVEVELRNKKYAGIVKRLHHEKPSAFQPKPIGNLLDSEPIIHPSQQKLWEWIAEYYLCSEGEVMAAALPAHFKLSSETILVFNEETGDDFSHLDNDEFLVAEALLIKKELKLSEVQELLDSNHVYPVIKRLIEKKVCFVWESLKETYAPKKTDFVLLNPEYTAEERLAELLNGWERAPKQLELLLAYLHLQRSAGEVSRPELLKKSGASSEQLKGLVEKNILRIERRNVDRAASLPKDVRIDFALTPAQQAAFDGIESVFRQRPVCLLHGVTSSGKTLIYIRQIESVIRQGRQALYLLPEIALTSQIIRRLQRHFGGYVGIYHSKFSQNERLETWNKIRTGEIRLVLGARSAIFLPFENLGLIIADEEHDPSYKQQEPAPRYHARDAAIYYASLFGARVILGSATPAVESYYNAMTGKYGLVELKERFGNLPMPEIEVIDTKIVRPFRRPKDRRQFGVTAAPGAARDSKEALPEVAIVALPEPESVAFHTDDPVTGSRDYGKPILSPALHMGIEQTLAAGRQVILFQNRRGYSPYQVCEVCGWIPQCRNCDVSLNFHKLTNKLHCHYCGTVYAPVNTCAACGNHRFVQRNFGTERIEEHLETVFPKARIARMDIDSVRGKTAHDTLIQQFEQRKVDILIGTQMVVKGLDFEYVSLVGILDADSIIHFAEFRANERAFQLMEQVSGRAGRKDGEGKVLIQAADIAHPVLGYVKAHDYSRFLQHELPFRQQFGYPPFTRIIRVTFRHKVKDIVESAAGFFAITLKKEFPNYVVGPAEPVIGRIRNQYLMELMLKLPKDGSTISFAKHVIRQQTAILHNDRKFRSVVIIPDVDAL